MTNNTTILTETPASGQKTFAAYATGMVLCLILTFLAFGVVSTHAFSELTADVLLASLAIIQLVVQCICFLRLNTSEEGQWNLLPFLFAILIIAILAGGSLWIMANLNYFMVH